MFSKNKIADVGSSGTLAGNGICGKDVFGLCHIWDLIRENNCEELFKSLNALDISEKEEILNGKYIELTEKVGKREIFLSFFVSKKENLQQESRPLFQAVMFGAFNCVNTLVNLGADILQQERHGWNIVHYLAVVSYFSLDYEPKAVKIYKHLLKNLQRFQIRALLHAEDKNGLRPLELAVHTGCLSLAKAILNTDGIYLIKLERRGLEEKAWYDVTEYEDPFGCSGRRSKSPLTFLTLLDRKVLKNQKALYELRHGILRKWAEAKFHSNALLIILWFLLRALCFVAFYCIVAIDVAEFMEVLYGYGGVFYPESNSTEYASSSAESNETVGNSTNETQCSPFVSWYFTEESPWSFFIIFILYTILATNIIVSLGWDFIGIFVKIITKSGKWNCCFGRKKNFAVYSTLYQVSQTLFMASTALYLIQTFLIEFGVMKVGYVIVRFCLIASCYLSAWSILYFVQLLPSVGHFVNIVQRMQVILLNFIVVYAILIFPFPHVFLVLLQEEDHCELEGFESFGAGFYSVFKLMVNMLDFRQMYGNCGKYIFTHCFFEKDTDIRIKLKYIEALHERTKIRMNLK